MKALTGSEKQVAWATEIRDRKVAVLSNPMAIPASMANAAGQQWVDRATAAVIGETDSGYWIRNRDKACYGLVQHKLERIVEDHLEASDDEDSEWKSIRPAVEAARNIAYRSFVDESGRAL